MAFLIQELNRINEEGIHKCSERALVEKTFPKFMDVLIKAYNIMETTSEDTTRKELESVLVSFEEEI